MTIQKAEKIEIEVQKQTMDQPSYKYLILIKSQNGINKFLKLFTTNEKPILKFSEDNGRIVIDKTNV
mgnify:FL=1|jgi:hypothetical protein|tara:strand:+ start:715 stop:915 length:201 start_codon:yes stop_codon:yes gene_type:complete